MIAQTLGQVVVYGGAAVAVLVLLLIVIVVLVLIAGARAIRRT